MYDLMLQSGNATKKHQAGETEETGLPTRWSPQASCTLSPEPRPLFQPADSLWRDAHGGEVCSPLLWQVLLRAWDVYI